MFLGAKQKEGSRTAPGGLAGWLLVQINRRLKQPQRPQPRLELIERIALAPRQSLALVEAEGRRFLVACSAEGTPSFYPISGASTRPTSGTVGRSANKVASRMARVSW